MSDTDICDCLMYIATGANLPARKANKGEVEAEGMTNYQYKCMLLDLRGDWQNVLDMLTKGKYVEAQKEVEEQIVLTNKKMDFVS